MVRMKENSNIISLLRFPLTIGIVFIHSISFSQGRFLVYDFFHQLIGPISEVCVPLFFFFSGYLFFIKIDTLNFDTYITKVKKRVGSLAVPHIFWNLFVVAVIGLGQMFAPDLFTGAFKNIADFTVMDWLSIFYAAPGSSQPIAFQLWFLLVLMIMTVLTPLFYFLCRFMNYWWCLVLLIAYVTRFHVMGFGFYSFFFYGFGCWFGIKKQHFSLKRVSARWSIILVYTLLLVIELCSRNSSWCIYFHRINVVIGCFAVIQACALYLNSYGVKTPWYMRDSITNSSFFIYCYHGIFALFIPRCVISFINNDASAVMWYFLDVAILVLMGIVLYNLLSKFSPRFLKVIVGNR